MTRTAELSRIDLRTLAERGPIHFVGISGAGMSALAELLLSAGAKVSGCDTNPGPIGERLRARGAHITTGQDAGHIVPELAAVITSSAIKFDHPELIAARAARIPVLKRAQALGALVNSGTVVAIAGTHGKTTTTAMTTSILAHANLRPTAFVGGRVPGWDSGLLAGDDQLFVVEADEYDRSFLTLRPHVAVVTTLEADHLDIYGSMEGLEEAFREFINMVPPEDGLIVLCHDDDGARKLEPHAPQGVERVHYGLEAGAHLRALQIEMRGRGSRFQVRDRKEDLGEVVLAVAGYHNIRNALAATAAAMHVGASFEHVREGLAAFTGVDRRFQEIGRVRNIIVIDDYAHHPTEVRATIAAARASYEGMRLVAVFQPHLYSRTRDLYNEFGSALAGADLVWVTDVYAAREAPIPAITGELVAQAADRAKARRVEYEPAHTQVPGRLLPELRSGDVVVFMGAGNIDAAARDLLARLKEESA
jgi:UDP-N-acetylmuramate--alanine ligase